MASRARSGTCTIPSGSFTSFLFDDLTLNVTKFNGITAWTNGVLVVAPTVLHLDSGTGHKSNSMDSPGRYRALPRRSPRGHALLPGNEDILISQAGQTIGTTTTTS